MTIILRDLNGFTNQTLIIKRIKTKWIKDKKRDYKKDIGTVETIYFTTTIKEKGNI